MLAYSGWVWHVRCGTVRRRRLCLADIGDSDIQLRLQPRRSAPGSPLGVLLFLVQHRGRFFEGFGIDVDFERPGIELVENVACFDVAPLLEIAVDDDTGHARAHLGVRVGVMRPGNSRITASGDSCSETAATSGPPMSR